MNAVDALALETWELLAVVGTWMVIAGVAGEGVEIVLKILEHKCKNQKFLSWSNEHKFGIEVIAGVFWMLVVLGLAFEFEGSYQAKTLTDKENVRLNTLSAAAFERAALVESNNLVLKAKLLEVETRTKWRTITDQQTESFITLTKDVLKIPIRVRMSASANAEAMSFATKIREILDKAGFVETNKDLAIAHWPQEMEILWNGGQELPPIFFLNNIVPIGKPVDLRKTQEKLKTYPGYATNTSVKTEFVMENATGDPEAYVTDENGSPVLHLRFPEPAGFQMSAFSAVQTAFNGIGIQTGWLTTTNIPTGVCEIFINPR